MKRHKGLFEKIVTFENFHKAAKRAMRGKRTKNTVSRFHFHLENEIIELCKEVADGSYRPSPYFQFEIREPKVRQICSSDFRDRVVHHAVCNVIEPFFERQSIFDSYACRQGRGAHIAVKRCQQFARRFDYFLKCDIRKYFESVDDRPGVLLPLTVLINPAQVV